MSIIENTNRPIKNHLLAALPVEAYQALASSLTLVEFDHGQILYRPGDSIDHVYFPNDAVVSLVYSTQDGESVEVGLVGMEGMVGIPFILGATTSPYLAIVQVSDGAMKMKATAFRDEFRKTGPLQDVLHRYTNGLMMQVTRTAVCNRIHKIEERLARWLLMVRDRMQKNEFALTHEFLADMLGVRRAGVTIAVGMLQQSGMIEVGRGRITITNVQGLESVACECYGVGRHDFASLGFRTENDL